MIKNILQKFVNMVYKWHWFWFKYHMRWLENYTIDRTVAMEKAIPKSAVGNISKHDKEMGEVFYKMVVEPLKETLNKGET